MTGFSSGEIILDGNHSITIAQPITVTNSNPQATSHTLTFQSAVTMEGDGEISVNMADQQSWIDFKDNLTMAAGTTINNVSTGGGLVNVNGTYTGSSAQGLLDVPLIYCDYSGGALVPLSVDINEAHGLHFAKTVTGPVDLYLSASIESDTSAYSYSTDFNEVCSLTFDMEATNIRHMLLSDVMAMSTTNTFSQTGTFGVFTAPNMDSSVYPDGYLHVYTSDNSPINLGSIVAGIDSIGAIEPWTQSTITDNEYIGLRY